MRSASEIFGRQSLIAHAPTPRSQASPSAPSPAPCSGCSGRQPTPLVAPLVGGWQGAATRKPRDYRIAACIPHLDTPEPLAVVIETLRWQTERPFIMILDTGSAPHIRCELEKLRAPDVEIHYIAGHGYSHSSEPVTTALDLAQSRCQSELLFHTHSDCFLKRREFLAELAAQCNADTPVIGYRMSPRDWATRDWEWMVGHTTSMFHMPTIHRIGATWTMQRMHHVFGYPMSTPHAGWPDTEIGFNCCLRDAGITPVFIGDDRNFEREQDANRDHVRSFAGTKLYERGRYHDKATGWMKAAIAEARARIAAR
jgi:hypothetical protein